ncbi:MAG: hypothetical protein ACFFD4_20830 [Candidatus Odinarchaeota archaeon]
MHTISKIGQYPFILLSFHSNAFIPDCSAKSSVLLTDPSQFIKTTRRPGVTVRVQVEDLLWSQHGKRTETGFYLAHNQKNFFHSQIHNKTAHLLREHGIGFWRADVTNTSRDCNYCGQEGHHKGKTFTCKNKDHKTPSGNTYTCNSDLNARRNVSLAVPSSLVPLLA